MKKLILLLLLIPFVAFGQMKITTGKQNGIEYKLYTSPTPNNNYFIMLHGKGQVGGSLDQVEYAGYPMHAKNGKEFPFNIIAPHIPSGTYADYWMLYEWFIPWVKDNFKADKIIVSGLSLGGIGTWGLLKSDDKGYIDAIAPIAGYYNIGAELTPIRNLRSVPGYSVHGDKDMTVRYDYDKGGIDEYNRTHPGSQTIAGAAQPLHYLRTLPGIGHDAWSTAYDMTPGKDGLLQWVNGIFGPVVVPVPDPVVKTEVINGNVVFTTESGKTVTLKP